MNLRKNTFQAQLEEQVRFEGLLADLSARLVGLPAEALEQLLGAKA